MLEDVIAAVRQAGGEPEIVSPSDVSIDVPVVVDNRPLSAAVNRRLNTLETATVVMADLALATPSALVGLFEAPGDIVVAPGRGGGTNALVIRHDGFYVDFHGTSYLDHCGIASSVGATVSTVDSFTLATDIDHPEDLVEVLLHADGASTEWLRDAGFGLRTTDGRTTVERGRLLGEQ
jgi:2-phospho-L-lactate guanylyltransferase